MSELPKAPSPADDAKPEESTAETQERADERPIPDDPTSENPHIGDVLADPNTNGARRG